MPNYTDADLSRFTYSHTWANRDEVKKIVQDLREARKEVDRLNDLNGRLRAEDVRQQQEVERLRAALEEQLGSHPTVADVDAAYKRGYEDGTRPTGMPPKGDK